MIPYFELTQIHLGPITIQVWGLMVSMGILAGLAFCYLMAAKNKLSFTWLFDLAIWAVVGGFIGGRLFFVLFYEPGYFLANPFDVVKMWQGGASSLGGFVGAAIAITFYLGKYRKSFRDFLPYADLMALGLWLGWGIGRLGCFFIHDHLGRLSGSLLAVNFPDGARYDLGLVDSIIGFTLFVVFGLLYKKLAVKKGFTLGFSFLAYAIVRFFADFLRATDITGSDVRYFSLTPAQYGMVFLALALTFLLVRSKMVKQN